MKLRARAFFLAIVLPPLGLVAACILADAPPTIEVPAPQRPVVVNAAVVPKLSEDIDDPRLLKFVVPIEVDSDQVLRYIVAVDFDPRVPLVAPPSAVEPNGTPLRTIEFDYTDGVLDTTQCHSISLFVALEFDSVTAYAPKRPPGGDLVGWKYRPRGVTCDVYDAGPLPEAGPDAEGGADGAADGGTE
ncbi:hypothetical protein BH09MYX1_BH09MYX1_49280 [soil metagenome]